jgi:hypothetical protein
MSFASVYPLYVAKAEKRGRTKTEVDEIIRWLTGYRQKQLEAQLEKQTDFETFVAEAPRLNPSRTLIKAWFAVSEWKTSKNQLCRKFAT